MNPNQDGISMTSEQAAKWVAETRDFGSRPGDLPTPRRMKANPQDRDTVHGIEHDWQPDCRYFPRCLPVDAPEPRKTPPDLLTIKERMSLSPPTPPPASAPEGTPVEPRNDNTPVSLLEWIERFRTPGLANDLKGWLKKMRDRINHADQYIPEAVEDAEHDLHQFLQAAYLAPTPPPAGAPSSHGEFYSGIEHFACWLLDHAEGETVSEEQLRRWAVEAWQARKVPPHASAPGTPVKRWPQLTETERMALDVAFCKLGPTAAHEIEELVERFCTLLDEKEERIDCEISRNGETCRIAEEQRTRAEKLQERLDGYLAKHGAPPLTVKTHGYMLMEKERDQLKADLAAAQEARDNNQNEVIRLLSCLEDEREQKRKLREALTFAANNLEGMGNVLDAERARAILAATEQGKE